MSLSNSKLIEFNEKTELYKKVIVVSKKDAKQSIDEAEEFILFTRVGDAGNIKGSYSTKGFRGLARMMIHKLNDEFFVTRG